MIIKILTIFSMVGMMVPILPTSAQVPQNILFGATDQSFVHRLKDMTTNGNEIYIESTGGELSYALDAADLIVEKHPTIKIVALCYSSCSEVILPAVSKYGTLVFFKQPLIGFHHNTAIVRLAFEVAGRTDFDRCFGSIDNRFRRLRLATGVPYDVWKLQERLMVLNRSATSILTRCRDTPIYLKNKFWFPTSSQLIELFHLKFIGSVCADHLDCMVEKLKPFSKNGDNYVIGTSRYEWSSSSNSLVPL